MFWPASILWNIHQVKLCVNQTLWPFSSSVIRELSSKALHNLTPRAPDYMAETGKQCCSTCSPGNGENKTHMGEDMWWFMAPVLCPFFLLWPSAATAAAPDGGFWPPRPPRSHSGLCRDHTRSLQSGPPVQQVDSLWVSDEVRETRQTSIILVSMQVHVGHDLSRICAGFKKHSSDSKFMSPSWHKTSQSVFKRSSWG